MDALQAIAEARHCEECGKLLSKNSHEKNVHWQRRRFCNLTCARKHGPRRPLAKRIAAKTVVAGDCHLWTGARNKDGYGQVHVSGTTQLAHRAVYVLHNGPIADDAQVLHHCDTPACINPDHLFLGDHSANMQDMVGKGRAVRVCGERQHASKLSPEKVMAIRLDGREHREIALDYGVSHATIGAVKRRETWKHVA